jgi:hypothetical protein
MKKRKITGARGFDEKNLLLKMFACLVFIGGLIS